ncbi:hypothetical protein DSO57_1015861 [Entomophthora muscae]|uniref:Uncharacterized protein n=1 Tax=Entomophthora muscae TaxID=34485 RepID=A0ACC2URC6_9FUNG|nr:hypothetical protein DSO57_1015861 [Entomophthora muscae]
MKNTLVSILVLCLSQASTQGILNDLLCKKLGLLDGCDVGGLAADPSTAKGDDLAVAKDGGKADLGASAEKLPGNIKDDSEDKGFKGLDRRGRNNDGNEREFDGLSRNYGGRGYDYGHRHGDDYEHSGREYRQGDDHSRRHGRSSYSVYRRSLPKRKVLLRRGDYGKDYRGNHGYENVDYYPNGYGSSRDYNDFGNYNHRHGNSYSYEY